jgi:hypothetical protein
MGPRFHLLNAFVVVAGLKAISPATPTTVAVLVNADRLLRSRRCYLLPLQGQPDCLALYGRSIVLAAQTTSNPSSAARPSDLLLNKRLAMRTCSQLVTTLKVASQPQSGLASDSSMEWSLQLVCAAALAGAGVLEWAAGGHTLSQM